MTEDIWNELRDESDEYGYKFRDAIFAGCKDTDSKIGVYAGSHDSYKRFAALYNPIIQEYHQSAEGISHTGPISEESSQLEVPNFTAAEADMIKSTRIRVNRNIVGFPLGAGMFELNRIKLEDKVSKYLETLEGEYEGRYYSSESMPAGEKQQLISEHLLFKDGDPNFAACGLSTDWPRNRGIFHN